MQVSKPGQNMCSSKQQSQVVSTSNVYYVNQCVVQEDQDKTSKWECQTFVISLCDDKNCQSTKTINMKSVKPAMKSSHICCQ